LTTPCERCTPYAVRDDPMKLYTYFRSSAAYRVRIALSLKGVAYEPAFVHLIRDGGQQTSAAFRALNPLGLVPAMDDNGHVITQSLAIIEYLDETYPRTPLLPKTPLARAEVRAFALAIACDIHPVNNLRILNYLKAPLGHDQAAVDTWYRHWTESGLRGCEALLPKPSRGAFCFGDEPSLADICLVPQMFNARRFKSDLSGTPRLADIDATCRALPAFANAAPDAQPDAS
jgi:maleylacetoacetate isomerase